MNSTWQDELDDILRDLRTMISCTIENVREKALEEGAEAGRYQVILPMADFESLLRNQWRKS